MLQDADGLTGISRFWMQVGANGTAALACDSPVSEAEALAVLGQLRQSPELTAELRFWMVNVHNGLDLMHDIQGEARVLARDVLNERDRT